MSGITIVGTVAMTTITITTMTITTERHVEGLALAMDAFPTDVQILLDTQSVATVVTKHWWFKSVDPVRTSLNLQDRHKDLLSSTPIQFEFSRGLSSPGEGIAS